VSRVPDSAGALTPQELVRRTDYLADEVKLLAINLAVALAKSHRRQGDMKRLEPLLAELIHQANETAGQVSDVIQACRNQRLMVSSVPASSEVITMRGGYDKIEVTLQRIYNLSQDVIKSLTELETSKQ
jgi:hypothetical protein